MLNLKEIIATSKKLFSVNFGADDFAASFGVNRSNDDKELDFARKLFAFTCSACGVHSSDSPNVLFKNLDFLKKEVEYLKSIGFKGKFAIHPVSFFFQILRLK